MSVCIDVYVNNLTLIIVHCACARECTKLIVCVYTRACVCVCVCVVACVRVTRGLDHQDLFHVATTFYCN